MINRPALSNTWVVWGSTTPSGYYVVDAINQIMLIDMLVTTKYYINPVSLKEGA